MLAALPVALRHFGTHVSSASRHGSYRGAQAGWMEIRNRPSAADPCPIGQDRHPHPVPRKEHALALPGPADQPEQPGNDAVALSPTTTPRPPTSMPPPP